MFKGLREMLKELMDNVKVNQPSIDPMEILNRQDMSLAHRQDRQMLAAGGIISKVASKILKEFGESGRSFSKAEKQTRKEIDKEINNLYRKDIDPNTVDRIAAIKLRIEVLDDEISGIGGDTKTAQELRDMFPDDDLDIIVDSPSDSNYFEALMLERRDLIDELKNIAEGPTKDEPIDFDIPFAEGGNVDAQMADMMPDDQMIAEAQAEDFAQEGMVPDEEMEEDYVEFIMSEALEPEEQQYLSEKLVEDNQLSMIFDKVVETASEFSGSGPVEGPGTGISDSIPARLSDGEFVMTAKATDAIGADTLDELMALAEQEADAGRQMKQTGGLITKKEEQEEQTQKVPSVVVEREQPLLVEEDPMQQKNKEAMRSLDPRLSLFAS